jgi:large subunit ribosomal protein L25
MNVFELESRIRTRLGKGATRRLRRSGEVPAILYGAESPPVPLILDANDVKRHLENEAFTSHILSVAVDGERAQAVLKEVHRDPISSAVIHMDFLRVSETHRLTMRVPLHFVNEDKCPGMKKGGVVSHLVVDLEVRCLPKDLPEYLEVDLGRLDIGETIHLSELTPPEGVEIVALRHGDDHALVSVQIPRVVEAVEEKAAEVEAGFDEEVSKLVQAGGDET